MYCSSCGGSVATGLSYCNYCGAKLKAEGGESKRPEIRPESLLVMMTATFIFGLVAITMLMGMLKVILRLEVGAVLGIAFIPFLLLLLLEGLFIRLLLSRARGAEATGEELAPSKTRHTTRELSAAQPGGLAEAAPSVTEHTTRTFDPLYAKRKTES